MVYYDHNRVVAIGGRKIGDEVNRELLKGGVIEEEMGTSGGWLDGCSLCSADRGHTC